MEVNWAESGPMMPVSVVFSCGRVAVAELFQGPQYEMMCIKSLPKRAIPSQRGGCQHGYKGYARSQHRGWGWELYREFVKEPPSPKNA